MAINGRPSISDAGPAPDVAREVYTEGMEDGDAAWGELADHERQSLIEFAEEYIGRHVAWLAAQGFRLLPPGMTLNPATEAEAMAMLQACKAFFDAQKRKGKLMASGPAPRKLILPPGAH